VGHTSHLLAQAILSMSKYFAAVMSREWGGSGASSSAGDMRGGDGKDDADPIAPTASRSVSSSADGGGAATVAPSRAGMGGLHTAEGPRATAPAPALEFFEFDVDLSGTDAAVSPDSFEAMLRCATAAGRGGGEGVCCHAHTPTPAPAVAGSCTASRP
jgi:hypothetical protein